jgi:hypothetical protein
MRSMLILLVVGIFTSLAQSAEFSLTFDKAALDAPFTGRVYVILHKNPPRALPSGLNWFKPEPMFALDVKNWKAGEVLTIDSDAIATVPMKDIPAGNYYAQAVMDRDLGGISFMASPGNVYSQPLPVKFDPKSKEKYPLMLDQIYEVLKTKEVEKCSFFEMESPVLTKFHKKPYTLNAGIILPPSYNKDPMTKYPIVYEITGFGGNHLSARNIARRNPCDVNGTEVIWVVLDANCRLGHHVFADSANNGPCGQALVEELIPAIEKQYRASGKRLVTGHSSGGWSSLWLQVTYPETFSGCWSTSPDSVDFRDFQRIDLYNPGSNMFTDSTKTLRPIARRGLMPALFVQGFSDMEVVMGRGGQLGSFEAVFSARGKDGQPEKLWDRKTGAINAKVAKDWEKYDIRLVLERNWKTLKPKLEGKIHVYMGDADTFYLEGATRLLKESQAAIGSDAVIELFPGRDHGLVDANLRTRMNKEMAKALKD